MSRAFGWIPLCAILWGCADDRSSGGGGFETGDLHARVTTPTGRPAARARVWLVRSNGAAAPATILDSGWTDPSGEIRLQISPEVDRSALGLDVRLGDSLGIESKIFRFADSVEIRLAPAGGVEAWIDSTRRIPTLFVPGSHFVSEVSDTAPKAALQLPRGTWEVVLRTPSKTEIVNNVRVGASTATVGAPAWSKKNLLWADSIGQTGAFVNQVLFRDPSYGPILSWSVLDSSLRGFPLAGEMVVASGSSVVLGAGKPSFSDKPYGAAVGSPLLPASGGVVVSWHTAASAESTPDLVRVLSFEDSSGGAFRLELDPARKPSEWIVVQPPMSLASAKVDSLTVADLDIGRWTFSWDHKYVYLWAGERLVGCAYRSSTSTQSGPRLRVGVGTQASSGGGSATIDSVRVYQPR